MRMRFGGPIYYNKEHPNSFGNLLGPCSSTSDVAFSNLRSGPIHGDARGAGYHLVTEGALELFGGACPELRSTA